MKVFPLRHTARGEQILGVEPPIAPQVRPGWLRRLNFYSGRSLSAGALEVEQNGRAGQVALGGQLIAPGIINGLTAALEQDAPPIDAPPNIEPVSDYYVNIGAGLGMAVNGEDVVLPQDLRVWLDDVLVIDRISTLGGSPPDDVEPGALSPRTLGPPLWQFRTELDLPTTYPRAGILVLQPVELEVIGDGDPNDPCEQDPENYSYEDWQRVDGCQLALYIWPGDWRILPVRGSAWRNRIANTIFQAEMELGPDAALPWELAGLPIALIGFTDDWLPEFIDRHMVARLGGQGQRRPTLASASGNPFLYRARIEQFTEHINELGGVSPDELNQAFNYVPPVGFLPTDVLNFVEQANLFFPPSYDINMRPIPLEQLDVVMKNSAGLQAFDLNTPDQIELLIPVPQAVYEPRLLVHEVVAPEFDAAIDRFVSQRGANLDRRANVRDKANAFARAITGEDRDFGDDPGTQADEVDYVPPTILGAHVSTPYSGLHQHAFYGVDAAERLILSAGDLLVVYVYIDPENIPAEVMLLWRSVEAESWEHRAYWGENRINWGISGTAGRFAMGDLPPVGEWVELTIRPEDVGLVGEPIDGMNFTLFGGNAAWAMPGFYRGDIRVNWYETELPSGAFETGLIDTWQWVAQNNLLAPLEDDFTTALVGDDAVLEPAELTDLRTYLDGTRLRPTDPDAPGAVDDVAPLDERGLEGYIDYLKDKINRADDKINIGFLRVHTDIYRVRQIMQGNTAGTQLAISPALAEIAKADTAAASREQINKFYNELQNTALRSQTAAPPPSDSPAATGDVRSFNSFALNTLDLGSPFIGGGFGRVGGGTQENILLGGTGARTTTPGFGVPATSGPIVEIGSDVSVIPRDTGLIFDFDDSTAAEIIRKSTESAFVGGTVYSPIDIEDSAPIVGNPVVRTTTIAERMEIPKAPEAKDFSARSKQDIYSDFANLDITLEGVEVPGAWGNDAAGNFVRGLGTSIVDFLQPENLGSLTDNLQPVVEDEAGHFSNVVDLVDNAVATLRIIEGRVYIYKAALARCQQTLTELRRVEKLVLNRLNVIGRSLAEARHDVAVARALRAEEQERLDEINERRLQVIAENVPFIAYQRPRVADTLQETPVRALVPGILEAPVPACLRQRVLVPKEIRAVVELLRDVPVRFFTHLPAIIDRLDQPRYFYDVVDTALVRAQATPVAAAPVISNTRFGQSINTLFATQQQVVTQYRAQVANVAASIQPTTSWQQLRDLTLDRLSLGDFINSRHGKSDVDNLMTQELDNIARVAACLHDSFSGILPVLRLEWADDISQFDAPVNLRNLSSLPRWDEIDYIERREMQGLVDWLFGRVNARYGDAVNIINDLVRVSLLLASEAPVDQLIAGKLRKPVTIRPGSSIKLDADISKVFVGMPVMFYQGNQLAARAIVQDMDAAGVAATITETQNATVDLGIDTTQVQFTATQGILQQDVNLQYTTWF